jgi:hypothetical protein
VYNAKIIPIETTPEIMGGGDGERLRRGIHG